MDEREYNNVYAIPANYTDSGKLLGGMIDTRNAIETVILVLALGYPELILIPMPGTIRIVVMTVTLLPLAVVSAMGVDGGSLFQYIGHIIHFWTHRRKLHFRRIGYASIKQPTIIQANLFGKLEIISATDVLKDDSFTNESGYVLLTFLLLNRKREHPLRLLTDVIWESTDMGNPYNSIKNVVYRLRKTLACIGLRDLIQASHGTFTLNPNYTIFTDVERFDDACKRIDNSSDPAILQALYESIIGLYRGSLLPRYDFYHWLMPKTLYYQNKFLHYMKRYLSMLYREKHYLRVQELSMDLLSIDMYESEVHYYLIKAMLMSGSKTLSQIYFRQAEPYLTDEHMQEVKTLFTSCRT